MIFPELPKLKARRLILHRSRKYFLKQSEVYAVLRTQRGFAKVAGHVLRSALRRELTGGFANYGNMYLSRPGERHRPEADIVLDWGHNFCAGHDTKDGLKYLTRYSYDDVSFVAARMPFQCPVCDANENPLNDWTYRLPVYWQEKQLICLGCWQKWTDFCQRTPIELIEIDDLIKKLNKEITDVTKKRRERHRAEKELRCQVSERDVRHA